MNVFEKIAALRGLMEEMQAVLPTLDDKARFYYTDDKYHEAWLITQTQYQTYAAIAEKMEGILNAG